jgi:hypothetical protein
MVGVLDPTGSDAATGDRDRMDLQDRGNTV